MPILISKIVFSFFLISSLSYGIPSYGDSNKKQIDPKSNPKLFKEHASDYVDNFFKKYKIEFSKKYKIDIKKLPNKPPKYWFDYINKLDPKFNQNSKSTPKYEELMETQLKTYFKEFVIIKEESKQRFSSDTKVPVKSNSNAIPYILSNFPVLLIILSIFIFFTFFHLKNKSFVA